MRWARGWYSGALVALTAVPAALARLHLSFSLARQITARTPARTEPGDQNPWTARATLKVAR